MNVLWETLAILRGMSVVGQARRFRDRSPIGQRLREMRATTTKIKGGAWTLLAPNGSQGHAPALNPSIAPRPLNQRLVASHIPVAANQQSQRGVVGLS